MVFAHHSRSTGFRGTLGVDRRWRAPVSAPPGRALVPHRPVSNDGGTRAARLGHRVADLPDRFACHRQVAPAEPAADGGRRAEPWARRPPAGAAGSLLRAPEGAVQRRLGFEIEMLALVDIDGRPIPEKAALGTYGAHNLELTVDHGPQVEAPTPSAPEAADFDVPLTGGNLHLRRFDLRAQDQARLVPAPPAPMAPPPQPDTRPDSAALLQGWLNDSRGDAFARPPNANNAGLDNTEIPNLDRALREYHELAGNWVRDPAHQQLLAGRQAITNWLANNVEPSGWHPINRSRYRTLRDTLVALRVQLGLHDQFWSVADDNPPAGWQREFRTRRQGALTPWATRHPVAGMGGDHYASILEIVTPAFEAETVPGHADVVASMTEAATLAQGIENATGNFANRVRLNTVPGTAVTNPDTYVGNAAQPAQTTDASLQSTFGVDLAQLPSLFKSTMSFMDQQQLFELKHHSDPGDLAQEAPRYKTAAARAPAVAQRVIRNANRLNRPTGSNPSLVHLRGLLTLMAQYLLMGKHFIQAGVPGLDKNIVPLLSRNDLGTLFNALLPGPERAFVAGNRADVRDGLLAEAGRAGASTVFTSSDETGLVANRPPYDLTCAAFVNNVLLGQPDGITGNLGGFHRFDAPEVIDPAGARDATDYRRGGAAHREGAIFELRNIIPHTSLNLASDRFPRAQWVPFATYVADMLAALNQRTQAQAVRDVRYRQVGGVTPEAADW